MKLYYQLYWNTHKKQLCVSTTQYEQNIFIWLNHTFILLKLKRQSLTITIRSEHLLTNEFNKQLKVQWCRFPFSWISSKLQLSDSDARWHSIIPHTTLTCIWGTKHIKMQPFTGNNQKTLKLIVKKKKKTLLPFSTMDYTRKAVEQQYTDIWIKYKKTLFLFFFTQHSAVEQTTDRSAIIIFIRKTMT